MKNFKKGLIYAGVLAFCIGFGAYIYCNSIKKKIPDKLYMICPLSSRQVKYLK